MILVENLSVPFDRRVWQEAKALTEAGYAVDVICPTGGTVRDTERHVVIDGVNIHRYPLTPATGGPLGYAREYPAAIWRTWRIARRLRRHHHYDVVHACNPPDVLFYPLLWMRRRGTKFVFDHHDLVPELFLSRFTGGSRLLFRLSALAERLTFKLTDGVISTNESYRSAAIERGGVDADRVCVVRSAPDLARFSESTADTERLHGKKFLAAYLGVMGPQDGVDYALRAIAHLRTQRDDFHCVFIGGGDAFDDMVELSKDLGLDDCVEFTGRISDEDLGTLLSTAHIGIAPDPKNPLNDVSTMNKIMEYMALGLPIVSFDLRESRVSAGDAAVYATPNDAEELGDLMGALFDDPDGRARMTEIGAERVAGELSWDVSKKNLIDFYDRLLA